MDILRQQYERFPYPKISLLAKVPLAETYPINYKACVAAAFGDGVFAVEKPRILVAGAGTFEPYVVALANPQAEILAVDISSRALHKLKQRLMFHGLAKRVRLLQADICNLSQEYGNFDFIIATGLLHHLSNRTEALKLLASRLNKYGIMRLMLYSKHGRAQIYRIRDLASSLGIKKTKELKQIIRSLESNHPLRIHFNLYGDVDTESGVMDGFLHAYDEPFDALDCEGFLSGAQLVAAKFLHSASGQVAALRDLLHKVNAEVNFHRLTDWQKIAVLDRLGELETNFMFLSVNKEAHEEANCKFRNDQNIYIELNPILKKGFEGFFKKFMPSKVYSRILGTQVVFDKTLEAFLQRNLSLMEASNLLGKDKLQQLIDAMILLKCSYADH